MTYMEYVILSKNKRERHSPMSPWRGGSGDEGGGRRGSAVGLGADDLGPLWAGAGWRGALPLPDDLGESWYPVSLESTLLISASVRWLC